MGGESWFYFVPYQADINRALQALRIREFQASEIFFAGYSFD